MTSETLHRSLPRTERSSFRIVWIVIRRELRDTLRDWRIITPILILTLVFPWLMTFTAQLAIDFVEARNATLIGERMIPFLLLIVGFFPITFSLVIALETFVGEKERGSIEPLLSMPITDLELYLGKMVSATIPPLIGSVLGISVYLGGLYASIGYTPPPGLIVQILALTIAEALVMVSGAVVVSSQTTSVRASNLLASFIIIPMALLLQAQAIVMFWGNYAALWIIVVGLLVVMLILIRMGTRTFNREEILGREIDELNLRRTGRLLRHFFVAPPGGSTLRATVPQETMTLARLPHWLWRVYRHDLPWLLRKNWMPIAVVVVTVLAATVMGWLLVDQFPLPEGSIQIEDLTSEDMQSMANSSFLPSLTTGGILGHNVQVLIAAGLLGLLSLGVVAILMLMVPMAIIGFFAGQMAIVGYNPWVFAAIFILPHGLFEIPAAIIATAFALRMGASVTAPQAGLTVGEGLLSAAADFAKMFVFLVIPLLLVAAFVEANLTTELVMWFYGS